MKLFTLAAALGAAAAVVRAANAARRAGYAHGLIAGYLRSTVDADQLGGLL